MKFKSFIKKIIQSSFLWGLLLGAFFSLIVEVVSFKYQENTDFFEFKTHLVKELEENLKTLENKDFRYTMRTIVFDSGVQTNKLSFFSKAEMDLLYLIYSDIEAYNEDVSNMNKIDWNIFYEKNKVQGATPKENLTKEKAKELEDIDKSYLVFGNMREDIIGETYQDLNENIKQLLQQL